MQQLNQFACTRVGPCLRRRTQPDHTGDCDYRYGDVFHGRKNIKKQDSRYKRNHMRGTGVQWRGFPSEISNLQFEIRVQD
jgi:hypothetical protein